MVLKTADFKLSRSLRKTLKRFVADPACEIRVDTATSAVLTACANTPREGQSGTWIVPELQNRLPRLGRAWRRAQHRDLDGWPTRRRALRRQSGDACSMASPCSTAAPTPPRSRYAP